MEDNVFSVRTSEGSYDLEASVRLIGRDLLIAIWGGEKPHIGAVAIAQPRPSLKDPSVTSSSGSVICLLGHKEDRLAKAVAEKMAARLERVVTVTAGIHWDDIPEEGIETINRNSKILVDMILDSIAGKTRFQ